MIIVFILNKFCIKYLMLKKDSTLDLLNLVKINF